MQVQNLRDAALCACVHELILITVAEQNLKFVDAPIKLERCNFESPSKGGYFGRIVLTAIGCDHKSAINLRQTLKRVKQHVVEITGHRYHRTRT